MLPVGTQVRITQTLGGSYTILTDRGHMFRIDAKDADALGITNAQPTLIPAEEFCEKLVWDQLKTVYDPEMPVNIVDLGLIYSCQITDLPGGRRIEVKMTITAPGCGMGEVLRADIERKLKGLPTVSEVNVNVVLDPPWHPGLMSEAARLQLGLDIDYSPTLSPLPILKQKT
jgi:probable FeS assembly SUF system protein SufT